MNRLFIHLFVVIVLGLVSINWLSEFLWQQLHSGDNLEQQQLANTLSVIVSQQSQLERSPEVLSSQLGFNVEIMSIDDVAWLPEQEDKLRQAIPVVTYTVDDQLMLYIKDSNSSMVYAFGPIQTNASLPQKNSLKVLLLVLSYLMLAGIIYLWTRPLWQDLIKLNQMAAQIGKGNFVISLPDHKRSPISNIVMTFHTMAERIIQLISDQRQLVNAVSHELRTPLARLSFSLEMLKNVPKQQQVDMKKDVAEMSTLIDEMLGYARLENIDEHTNKETIDLVKLIQASVEKSQRLTTKTIDCHLPDMFSYQCNEQLIERAVQNLLSNALRYANTRVLIKLTSQNDSLYICVEDDGEGIAPEERDKIFDAFYRVEKSRNKDLGGFGLGLAIVDRICRTHKGSCHVKDSSLGGCKFTITLPC
ncbi:ATP-binding protein [Thalassotalea sediminis]|uniref:ATP-binding protein n=1 Tax=Thalassotalea sediminis TaxID=1759089 RepID=UPI0025731D85|nr:ATP-binding protein [Thalassotalea sediminis]